MHARLTALAAAALLAASCGGKGQADASANADTGLTASAISSNDVTAIDAVPGEAANMAPDMDFTNVPSNPSSATANGSAPSQPSSRTKRESGSAPAQPSEQQPPAEPGAQPASSTE